MLHAKTKQIEAQNVSVTIIWEMGFRFSTRSSFMYGWVLELCPCSIWWANSEKEIKSSNNVIFSSKLTVSSVVAFVTEHFLAQCLYRISIVRFKNIGQLKVKRKWKLNKKLTRNHQKVNIDSFNRDVGTRSFANDSVSQNLNQIKSE